GARMSASCPGCLIRRVCSTPCGAAQGCSSACLLRSLSGGLLRSLFGGLLHRFSGGTLPPLLVCLFSSFQGCLFNCLCPRPPRDPKPSPQPSRSVRHRPG